MIDWDGSGLGPAVLDLGYLLMTCHLGKPQLPAIEPDALRIAAVVRGYCQERQLADNELSVLEDAVRYGIARRVVQGDIVAMGSDNWRENIWIQKMLARYRASSEIAEIACECLSGKETDDEQSHIPGW